MHTNANRYSSRRAIRESFGIARDIKALAAVSEHVAIAASLVMEQLARRRPALEVVHRHGLDDPAVPLLVSPLEIRVAVVTVLATAGGAQISVDDLLTEAIESGSMWSP